MSRSPLPAWVARLNAAEAARVLSTKTERAVSKYGFANCVQAFEMHTRDGEGASTIGFTLGLTTRQADAAINAGQEIHERGAKP